MLIIVCHGAPWMKLEGDRWHGHRARRTPLGRDVERWCCPWRVRFLRAPTFQGIFSVLFRPLGGDVRNGKPTTRTYIVKWEWFVPDR